MKLTVGVITLLVISSSGALLEKFPDDFLFGVATSAYQIEGAWNVNGKGESHWDYITHNTQLIKDNSTGDIACDSYHNYKKDVELIKYLGVDFYRFSIAWARILPDGTTDNINKDGIDYYNNLINELIRNKITPMVTLYHWDIPMALMRKGGFQKDEFATYFERYADLAFQTFGDRVKYWFTFNEPNNACLMVSYPNNHADKDYICSRNLLRAHAKAYHVYDKKYRATQKGRIAIVLDSYWHEPATTKPEDILAANRFMQFMLGIWAHPIYHGDYPPEMRAFVSYVSELQGRPVSRLPKFSPDEIDEIKGTNDFFAFNHYSTKQISFLESTISSNLSRENDAFVLSVQPDEWPGSNISTWLKIRPSGFRSCLKWIKDNYNDPEIIVTENGFADMGQMQDTDRIKYYESYMTAMLQAVHIDKVRVKGYTAWSLMDNFEWIEGYRSKFGLFSVDFADPKRKRTPKASAKFYKRVIARKHVVSAGKDLANSTTVILTAFFYLLKSICDMLMSTGFVVKI